MLLADSTTTAALISAVVAMIVTPLTAWTTFGRFRSERWWDLRLQAYSRVIVAIHTIFESFGQLGVAQEKGSTSEAYDDENHRRAWDELHQAINTSGFLLSSEASQALDEFTDEHYDHHQQMHKSGDFATYLYNTRCELEHLLLVIPEIARRDLGVDGVGFLRGFLRAIKRKRRRQKV